MYSTLTNLWKNDTTSMIVKNVDTGIVYSLSSSPQKSFDENSMVFGRRESENKYVNGQLIYDFFQNEVPLLDWNKKVWVLVTITNKSINGQNEKSNFSSEECLTITDIITFNSSAKEVKVKNTATGEKYILKLIPDSKNTLPKEYPLLLNDLEEPLCLVETEKDNSYSKYFNQKVWIKIR